MSDVVYKQLYDTKSGRRLAHLWQRLRFYTSTYSGADVSELMDDSVLLDLVKRSQAAGTVAAKRRTIRAVLKHVENRHGITTEVLDGIDPLAMILFMNNRGFPS